ncbi:MAG: ArnT family glycosyltransferase [Anaerolineae bacterium]
MLGAFLRFYQLGAYSIGNTYYAATVKSMLTSWHNFFYAAFEPGGSVTVDKPPLGFWVQAISAYFLGVNGFALALPNALAGLGSILLVYHLVRRRFGVWPGLAAALALAVTPVTIAAERNNTIDGLLVFVLLLAAWAFLKASESGKLRHLLLGVFLVGLGFNIKMVDPCQASPGDRPCPQRHALPPAISARPAATTAATSPAGRTAVLEGRAKRAAPASPACSLSR